MKIIFWILILVFTAFPFLADIILHHFNMDHTVFIWSVFLISSMLIMIMYPNWIAVISSGIFYTSLKFIQEFSIGHHSNKMELIILILGSIINWMVHLAIGFFRIKSYRAYKEVEKLTVIDSLTGLYNRRYFNFYMEKSLAFFERMKNPIVLIMIDIDNFKRINDQFGHQCGDEALKHIAEVVKRNVRSSDGYVRFGGEEFAIILPDTMTEEAKLMAERIRKRVELTEFIYKNTQINLTISLGVSLYRGETLENFIGNADRALYQAKKNGKNQVVVFE